MTTFQILGQNLSNFFIGILGSILVQIWIVLVIGSNWPKFFFCFFRDVVDWILLWKIFIKNSKIYFLRHQELLPAEYKIYIKLLCLAYSLLKVISLYRLLWKKLPTSILVSWFEKRQIVCHKRIHVLASHNARGSFLGHAHFSSQCFEEFFNPV